MYVDRPAHSLVMDLLSAMPDGLPVAVLIDACAILGVTANNVRVSLTRLKRRKLIEAIDRGVSRLGPAAKAVNDEVRAWRHIETLVSSWDGSWIAVHSGALPRSERSATKTQQRAFRLLGFRELSKDLHVRPNNLRRGVAATRMRLHELGLDARSLVFRLAELDGDAHGQAVALWDASGLAHGYRDMTTRLCEAEKELARAPLRTAAREVFALGGEAIRMLATDPLLPEPIVDAGSRRRLVEAMCRFDIFGRKRWQRVFADASRGAERYG